MKKILLTLTSALACFTSTLCANNVEIKHVYKFEEIKPEDWTDFSDLSGDQIQEKMHGVAIELSKNTVLPLKLFIKGDLIRLISNPDNGLSIKVLQKLYIAHNGRELLVSHDLKKFSPINEFITGSIEAECKPHLDGLAACLSGDFRVKR